MQSYKQSVTNVKQTLIMQGLMMYKVILTKPGILPFSSISKTSLLDVNTRCF